MYEDVTENVVITIVAEQTFIDPHIGLGLREYEAG